ncbi:HMG-box domain [Rhizoctonia solani]|uniref:HMG-box domain n=1 Tax=Rhizoctonia solani TaxID=456999 RepID=A0A8H7M829_9AGAM|nr:HMG-box domain [Rhizoctonia solani]
MIFPIDDMLDQPPQGPAQAQYPRTGTLDSWDEALSAYTHVDQLTFDEPDLDNQGGSFCLSDPNSFSGTPSSWDVGSGISIEPPLTPDSPPYHGDSFGVSPGQLAPSLPRTPRLLFPRRAHLYCRPALPNPHPAHWPSPNSAHQYPHAFALVLVPAPGIDDPFATAEADLAYARHPTPLPPCHRHPLFLLRSIRPGAYCRQLAEVPHPRRREDSERWRRRCFIEPEGLPEQSADLVPPTRSRLNPPKQAPSTWQIFFTEYLQNYKATNPSVSSTFRKLQSGAAYKALSPQQKEIYKRKARLAKQEYDRELAAWQRMLTPEDIRVENAFRSAQRKAGKSRRSNLKDPNAPKKPLSAYFMFLQWIRADPARIQDVFGTRPRPPVKVFWPPPSGVSLAMQRRSPFQPFLAQAEREKLEYEAARKVYEERTSGISNNSWGTSADAEVGGRRGSSSSGKLPGGASFGAIMFSPTSTYDEEAVADGDMEDMLNTIHWK